MPANHAVHTVFKYNQHLSVHQFTIGPHRLQSLASILRDMASDGDVSGAAGLAKAEEKSGLPDASEGKTTTETTVKH